MVARVLWEHDVAGSNPVIPTIKGRLYHSYKRLFSFIVRFRDSMFATQTESCFAFGECCIPTKKEKIALAVVFSFLLFSYSPFVNIELTKKMLLINSFYLILIYKRDII